MTEQRANAELWEAPVTNDAAGGCVMAGEAQRRIGKKLAQFYGGILHEPIPDYLLVLLEQLDTSGSGLARSETAVAVPPL